jgi:putative transposase
MSERFQERYRIPSTRLQNWDYGWNAIYFITLCTAGHEHVFGKIVDGLMHLSEIGLIAEKFWYEIPLHFKFIELDAFVVMPNHIHGILIINKNDDGRDKHYDRKDEMGSDAAGRDAINRVSTTTKATTVSGSGGMTGAHNPMLHKNLSRVIRWYKGRVTFESRRIIHGFDWQARFYDHIVWSDESFNRIRQYIETNAANWEKDEYFN